jgi:hypothetical protein
MRMSPLRALFEAQLSLPVIGAFVPASWLERDLLKASELAGGQKLLLQAGKQQLLEFVKVGRAIDQDGERSAAQGFEGTMIAQKRWHQALPARGDLGELGLAFLDGMLEELDHRRAQRHGGGAGGVLHFCETSQFRFLRSCFPSMHGKSFSFEGDQECPPHWQTGMSAPPITV